MSFSIFLTLYDGRVYSYALLVLFASVSYFRPAVNNGKYILELAAALLAPLLIPARLGSTGFFVLSALIALIVSVFIGLKNIIFINRDKMERLAYLSLIVLFALLYFANNLGPLSDAILFIAVFVFGRRMYAGLFRDSRLDKTASAVFGFILVQANWLLLLSPISDIARIIASVGWIIVADNFFHHLAKADLTNGIFYRNMLIGLTAMIFILRVG